MSISLEEKLKKLILSRHKSVLEFATMAGIPYSTVRSILERGVDNSSVINVIKICNALSISVDALANGYIEKRPKTNQPNVVELNDVVNSTMSEIENAQKLTIDGKEIDIEMIEPMLEALDIGYEMVKRKQKTINKNNKIQY